MTNGFQHQDRSVNFCFPKSVREPHHVGQKLPAKPATAAPVPAPRPAEPRTFK
jgi:hypothetical protein